MVDNSWAFELGNTIFYVVKSRAEPILQKKFPDVVFDCCPHPGIWKLILHFLMKFYLAIIIRMSLLL